MADDVQGLSLEEPALVGPITQKVEDDEPLPEGTTEMPTGKVVPLPALVNERTLRKTAQGQVATLTTERDGYKAKADELDRVKDTVAQAMPLIEKMRGRPDLIAQLDKPLVPQAAPKPMTDDEAVSYAKDFDLYTPEGKPDVDRAQRIVAVNDARSERKAKEAMAPLIGNEAQRASNQMKVQIASFKDNLGHTVDADILNEVWNVVPADLSAQPNVAAMLHRVALAESILRGKYKGTQPPGPGAVLHTESIGGSAGKPGPLSDIESRFAKSADMTQADFTKTAGKYKPGAVNSLE